jgi:hypothetical protein
MRDHATRVIVAEKFARAMRRITIAKRKRAKEKFRGFDVCDLNNSSARPITDSMLIIYT